MKWFTGLGKRLAGVFSPNDESAEIRRHQERVVSLGLPRVLGHPADKAAEQDVLAQQRTIAKLCRQLRERGAAATVKKDGLSHLEPYQKSKRGYVLVYVQGFLTQVLQHLARIPHSNPIANVVFQPREDPSAHISVLERGHGLAFEIPFFPTDEDEALLCEFFGELTAISLKASAFAVQAQAPVLPLWCRLEDNERLCLEIGPALEDRASANDLAQAIMDHFQSRIRTSPAEMDWEADCWHPPIQRLLPSRLAWHAASPPENALESIKPFRLLVRVPDSVREACLAIPAVRALKRGRPDVHLTVLTPSAMHPFWDLLEECDTCLDLEADPAHDRVSYDLGVLLNQEQKALAELAAHSIVRSVGMETHPVSEQLDEPLKMPRKLGPPEHRHRTYLRVAHRLGAEVVQDKRLRSPVIQKRRQQKRGGQGKRRPSKSIPVIGVAPDSNDGPSFAWPVERFMEVLKLKAPGDKIAWRIFLNAESDLEPWEALRSELGPQKIKLIHGAGTIAEQLDVLANCSVVLANDNNYLHLAATVHGLPTIAIYGPSEPSETAPVSKNALTLRRHVECTPCFLSECPIDHRCLEEIPVEEVMEALDIALQRTAPTAPTASK